jgi:hypothetical protein
MTTDLHSLRATRLACCLAAALGMTIGSAHGAVPVTSCADDGSAGTLRKILSTAANNAVIDVSNCSAITLTQGEIPIGVSVTLQGPASGTTTVDANHTSRAFHSTSAVADYQKLKLVALTVTGGYFSTDAAVASGGCILGGDVTLENSVVTDCFARAGNAVAQGGAVRANAVTLRNSRVESSAAQGAPVARALGGGVFATAQFKCYDSSISGNAAIGAQDAEGGGIAVTLGSALLSGCTVDSNFSHYAGGILQFSAGEDTVAITNSTISGNLATVSEGGLRVQSPLTMKNSTVAYNVGAETCGGVHGFGDVTVDSSIIAANASGDVACVDLDSELTLSGANNLVSVVTTAVPGDTIVANPRLTTLADHGGPTRTHGLSLTSPAIDHGKSADTLATDQRGVGFSRVVGTAADIGAFERRSDDDELFYGGLN